MSAILAPEDYVASAEIVIAKAAEIVPTHIIRSTVSEWAEKKRTLKEGNFQGPFSFDLTPYLIEIADELSATSATREVVVMKGTRMGATVGLHENWLGYTIDEDPAEMAYLTASDELAGAQVELRVDSLIDNSGIAEKIGTQEKRASQKKTGDRTLRKTFPGGYMMAGGPRSAWIKRQFGFKKIAVDEVDEFPDDVDKNGDPIALIRGRVMGYEDDYKILWASSPRLDHNSKIKQLYEEGDQRKFFVPCPECGHMQFLKWGAPDKVGGVKFEYDEDDRLICELNKDGKIVSSSVYYECEHCQAQWKNADKDKIIPLGEWRPTAVPRRPGLKSYHLPTLYSLIRSWEAGVQDFLQIKHEGFPAGKYQVWVNTFLAETWVDQGERPRVEALITRTRRYVVGQLPEDARPLFVTIGADVQADRIECEIVAWGRNKESWSIDYRVFHGETDDLGSLAWEGLRETILAEHSGMTAVLTGVDSGYRTDTVYEFADSFEAGVHAVMGQETISAGRDYIKLYSVGSSSSARVDVNTDLLKQEIYRYLNKGQYEGGAYPAGYMHFPADYGRQHMNQLTAETRVIKGNGKYGWDSQGRRNEQLDCRTYALAMVYAYKAYIQELEGLEELSWTDFWDYLDPPDTTTQT